MCVRGSLAYTGSYINCLPNYFLVIFFVILINFFISDFSVVYLLFLCTSYCVLSRLDYQFVCLFVVPQNSVTIPGMMGILPIERPCDIETGEFNKKACLVYHYGHTSPGPNLKLYKTAVTAMAKMFEERCKVSPKSRLWVGLVGWLVFTLE